MATNFWFNDRSGVKTFDVDTRSTKNFLEYSTRTGFCPKIKMKGGKNISKLSKLYKSDPDIYKSGRYMYLAKSASYLYIKGDILYCKCFWHICIVTNHPEMSGTLPNFLPLFRKGPGWPSSGPLSRNSNVHLFSHIPNAGPLSIMRSNIHLRMRS